MGTHVPKRRPSATKPDSVMGQIAAHWIACTHAVGRGVTIAEARAAWADHGDRPAPPDFATRTCQLRRRGVLVATEGRNGQKRYAHRDSAVPLVRDPDDLVRRVLRALRDAVAAARRPVETREVCAQLRLMGETGYAGRVTAILRGLAHRRKGQSDAARPPSPAVRAWAIRPVGRVRAIRWWLPVDDLPPGTAAEPPAGGTVPPWSARDALWQAVEEARAALGQPPTRTDVERWLAARRLGRRGAGWTPRRLLRTFGNIGRTVDWSDGPGAPPTVWAHSACRARRDRPTVSRIHTRFTCRGTAAPRFAVVLLTPVDVAAIGVEDAIRVCRIADEAAGIAELEHRAAHEHAPALAALAACRRRAVAQIINEIRGAIPLDDVLAVNAHACAVRAEWATATPTTSSGGRRRRAADVSTRARGHALMTDLLREPREREPAAAGGDGRHPVPGWDAPVAPGVRERLQVVGEAAVLPIHAWADLQATALEGRGRVLASGRITDPTLAAPIRRFRLSRPDRRWEAGAPHAQFDRVDAFLSATRAIAGPVAALLIEEAGALLGHVLRDVGVVAGVLAALPPAADHARRALVVALGLLGADVTMNVGLPNPGDADDLAAYLLALTLADTEGAMRRVREVAPHVRGAVAIRVLQEAIMRLDAGEPLAVVG